jgi:hypothetical protein
MFQDLAAMKPTLPLAQLRDWQGRVMRCQAASGVEVGAA